MMLGGGSFADAQTTLYYRTQTGIESDPADAAEQAWSATDYDGTSEGSWTGDVSAVTLSSNAIKIESPSGVSKSISKSLSYSGYPILTFDAVWNIGSKSGNNNAANRTYFMIGDQIRFQHYPRSAANWAKVTIGGSDIKKLDGSPVEESVDWTIHVVINTFTNTITEFTVSSSNSAFSMSLSDIPEAKRSLSSTSVYSTLTLGTEAGTKPVTSLKSIKVQAEKQVYQYTVNYKTTDESIVKAVSAYNYPGVAIPVQRIITGDDSEEYIVTDIDLPSQTIADDTDDADINVINLNVRKRYKCNLIVKNSFDGVIDEDFTVVTPLEESEEFAHSWKYVFPLYKKKGDDYYKATLKSTKYGEEGTFEYDNITKTVEYTLAPFVCYVADESLGTNIDYSYGTQTTIYKTKVSLGAFTKGYYTLTGRMGDSKDRTFYIYSKTGEVVSESLGSLSGKNGAISTQTICLADDVDELYLQNTSANTIYDYVVVERSHVAISAVDNLGYTFSSTLPLDFTGTTVEAYTAAYNSTSKKVELNRIYKVPANTGLFIKGTAGDIPVLTGDADVIGTNNLVAVSATTTVNQTDGGDNTNFVLGVDNAAAPTAAVFLKAPTAGVSVGAGKAYLQIPTASAPAAARMAVVFNDETTGISQIENGEWRMKNSVYNLRGQRVAQPQKGLYIVNGKKVIVK
jgi:hypothetical protein